MTGQPTSTASASAPVDDRPSSGPPGRSRIVRRRNPSSPRDRTTKSAFASGNGSTPFRYLRWASPALGIGGLPGQNLLGERVHAGRGLAGPDSAENGHSGIEAPLRDNEPGRVADFDGFDRVVNLPDNDARPGVFVGRKGPGGQQFEGGQVASHILKPDPPDRDEKQPADDDGGGRDVVPPDDPGVEVGGVIEHQVEHWIVAGQGERPVEETPSGAAKPANDEGRIARFHRVGLRRVSARLGCVFGAFPQG